MMLTLEGGLGAFVQQTGRGAYTGPATQADWDAFDAYVAAEVAALRSMGLNPSLREYHPTIFGGTGPHHEGDAPGTGEGAYYEDEITLDPVKYPGYVRLETIARYRDYSGGDAAKAAAGAIRDAQSQAQQTTYFAQQDVTDTSQPGSQVTYPSTPLQTVTPSTVSTPSTPSSVVESVLNSFGASSLVSSETLGSIPTWAWIAGAVAAGWLLFGRGK